MHNLLLITKNSDGFENANEARREILDTLQQDNSFCGDEGRFNSPVADWFVIGGRWSGYLQNDYKNYEEAKKLLNKKSEDFISTQDMEDKNIQELLNKTWTEHNKTGINPLCRDNYQVEGYEDDCMLVTKELYDKFLKKFENKEEIHDDVYQNMIFFDLDYEIVSEEFIDTKYIIVVDYHN